MDTRGRCLREDCPEEMKQEPVRGNSCWMSAVPLRASLSVRYSSLQPAPIQYIFEDYYILLDGIMCMHRGTSIQGVGT